MNQLADQRPITVVFRYDDFSAISDTETEHHVFAAFADYGISCLVGAIPLAFPAFLPLSSEKASFLREAVLQERLEVALHGYTHEPIAPKSEFAGLALPDQRDRIREGKRRLEHDLGLTVKMFIPPWNRYDENTIVALENEGIQLISGHKRVSASWPPHSAMLYLPSTCKPQHLRTAIDAARRSGSSDCIVGVVMHEFNFVENNAHEGRLTYLQFRELLEWLCGQNDVRVASYRECITGGNLGLARCLSNSHLYPAKLLPKFMAPLPDTYLYLSESAARRWWVRSWLFVGSYFLISLGGLLGVAYAAARRIVRWGSRPRRASQPAVRATDEE